MENYIGDNIHAIRGNFGLSQEQLAAIAEVSQTSVSAWECGQTIPRFSNAVKIVESLPSLTMDDVYSQVLGYARRVLQQAHPESGSSSDLFPCMDLLLRVLPSRCFRSRKSILCPMRCCCVIRKRFICALRANL